MHWKKYGGSGKNIDVSWNLLKRLRIFAKPESNLVKSQ